MLSSVHQRINQSVSRHLVFFVASCMVLQKVNAVTLARLMIWQAGSHSICERTETIYGRRYRSRECCSTMWINN